MERLSFTNKLLYIVNCLLAISLLLSYLLPWVSPKVVPNFAIFSLLEPVLLLLNLMFIVYWILQLKKQFLLSSITLCIGYFIISPLYKFEEKNTSKNNDLKIMTYNVRNFNHWRWIPDENIPNKIKSFIEDKNPDVLLFQEFHGLEDPDFNYPYKYIKIKNKKSNIGLAIYSKFKIIHKGSLELQNTANNIIYADILKEKDTIRVYNLHLQSLELNTNAKNFGQENSEKLIARLRDGFKIQAQQTTTFLNHETKWKGKKIIAGDFNNTAYSWVYKQIFDSKKDAFLEAGKGFGKTFNYWFPLRIDFILTNKNANVNKFIVFDKKYSDHFPVQARIHW